MKKYNFYGTVKLINHVFDPNTETFKEPVISDFDITTELLKRGLAEFVEWNLSPLFDIVTLKNIEEDARSKKLKVWGKMKKEQRQQRVDNEVRDCLVSLCSCRS